MHDKIEDCNQKVIFKLKLSTVEQVSMMKGPGPWVLPCGGLSQSSGELGCSLKSGNERPSY